jgi:hypothetical protein
MYCDRCGSLISPASRFCGTCGKAIQPGSDPAGRPAVATAPAAPPQSSYAYQGRVERHVRALAILWCINGILRLLEVGSFYAIGREFLPWFGRAFPSFGFPWAFHNFPVFGLWWAALFLGFFGLLHLFLAWSLYEFKPWARILGLVVGFLALLRFPLGTALGAYTIWVLLPESSGREYERLAHA